MCFNVVVCTRPMEVACFKTSTSGLFLYTEGARSGSTEQSGDSETTCDTGDSPRPAIAFSDAITEQCGPAFDLHLPLALLGKLQRSITLLRAVIRATKPIDVTMYTAPHDANVRHMSLIVSI